MNKLDLLRMSIRNLWVRKLRTILTLLGVVIGTTSIIVMISLGLGMRKIQMDSIERMGSLTTLSVSSNGNMFGGFMGMGFPQKDSDKKVYLNDAAVRSFETIPHVRAVGPELSGELGTIRIGKYEWMGQVVGVNKEYFEDFGLTNIEGSAPANTRKSRPYIYLPGNFTQNIYDPNEGFTGFNQITDVNPMKERIKLEYSTYDEHTGRKITGKSWNLAPSGIYEQNSYMSTAYILLDDYKYLQKEYQKVSSANSNSLSEFGESSNANKTSSRNRDIYSSISVKVDDISNVAEVKIALEDMGYGVSSMMDIVEEMNKSMQSMQSILAGIGSVALLVAAIGITNTMVMSVYERTKEIGVMKVIGAAVKDIRQMFLSEAILIGTIGGLFGVGFSLLLSSLINFLVGNSMTSTMIDSGTEAAQISYIPFWLVVLAVVFSGLIGLIAGYIPAKRATKLSAIEAIKTE